MQMLSKSPEGRRRSVRVRADQLAEAPDRRGDISPPGRGQARVRLDAIDERGHGDDLGYRARRPRLLDDIAGHQDPRVVDSNTIRRTFVEIQ